MNTQFRDLDLTPVPEPATLLLFVTAAAELGLATRWKRRMENREL